jgi:hypothetical protein
MFSTPLMLSSSEGATERKTVFSVRARINGCNENRRRGDIRELLQGQAY